MTGTRLTCPLATAVPIDWVSTLPSMSGVYPEKSSLSTMVATGRLRRHAAAWLAQATLVGHDLPAGAAGDRGARVRSDLPLSALAGEHSPRAAVEASCASTRRPPADSPKRVTLRG